MLLEGLFLDGKELGTVLLLEDGNDPRIQPECLEEIESHPASSKGRRGFESLIHHFEFPTKYHEFSLLAKAFC